MKGSRIDFDCELSRGLDAYNDTLGEWWHAKTRDASHIYAYRNIAGFIKASLTHSPRLILDYACGAGDLLLRLGALFPGSHLLGIDGSSFLLNRARRRLRSLRRNLERRITLIESPLPCFDHCDIKADLAIFAFPNMVWSPGAQCRGRLGRAGLAITRSLARECDPELNDPGQNPEAVGAGLYLGRVVSLNLRRLLKQGGLCVRVEYGRARRHELSEMELRKAAFEEGSLDIRVKGRLTPHWFRVLASSYFRSGVIEDVDQQAGKRDRRPGGYVITVLRAI